MEHYIIWYAVNSGKICPTGWHLTSESEWNTLTNYLILNGYNFDGTLNGNKIGKALASPTGWTSSSTTGALGAPDHSEKRNSSGFNAVPGGYRLFSGVFYLSGSSASWWSATVDPTYPNTAICYLIGSDNFDLKKNSVYKSHGLSVRCIKN